MKDWLPTHVNLQDQTCFACEVTDDSSLDLDMPFFHHALENLLEQHTPELKSFDLSDFIAASEAREPKGMIFHASRCGSTLISQAIAALDGETVIVEAQPINATFYLRDRCYETTTALLGAMCQWRPSDNVFIKQTSINVIRAARHLSSFPNAKWLFLFRDPAEIMVSISKSAAGWSRAQRQPEDAARMLRTREDVASMSVDDYLAFAIDRMFHAALDLDHRNALFIDYADLDLDGVFRALDHLNIETTEKRRKSVEESTRYYSKDRRRERPYAADRTEKRALITESIRQAAKRTDESFQAMRAISSKQ